MPASPWRTVRSTSFCMSAPAPTSSGGAIELHAAPIFGVETKYRAVHPGVADQQIGTEAQDVNRDVIFSTA